MRAVIFDWGGTLTPWRTIDHVAAWRAYSDVLHPADPAAAEELALTLAAVEAAAWEVVRDEARAFRLADVLVRAGVDEHEAALAAYRKYWDPATYTDPDVAPLLTALRQRGLRTGVLSSTSWPAQWHVDVLRRDGVFHLFDGCVWTSDLDWTKPHELAFAAAMAAVGVDDPADCVYVGDRPYNDVTGAKAIGMRAVLVPHSVIPPEQQGAVSAEPDAVIQRLSDLVSVVDGWRGVRNVTL